MEGKNTIALVVIGIATMIIVVAGASFAYFASSISADDTVPVGVTTDGASTSFIATSSGEINISVDAYLMQESSSDDNNTSEDLIDAETLSVYLSSSKDNTISTCQYDIIFVWEDDANEYVRTDGAEKEFTITGTLKSTENVPVFSLDDPRKAKFQMYNPEFSEINIDELDWQTKMITEKQGDSEVKKMITYAVLIDDAKISSLYLNQATVVNWEFEVKFYNVKKDQSSLKNKKYGGYIKVDPDSILC